MEVKMTMAEESCSKWGENWAQSMPEDVVEEKIEEGTLARSCKE
jgi:hypothetical protein